LRSWLEPLPGLSRLVSCFDSFLKEERILDEIDPAAIKREVEWQLDNAAQADAQEGIWKGLEDEKDGKLWQVR
jgi:hypothetical protein